MLCPDCAHDNIPGTDLCENCGLDLAGLDVRAWGVSPGDPLLSRKLSDLSLKEPLVLGPQATVAEAIELMAEHHEGCVFVVDEHQKLVGVVTERDVALRVAARGRHPQKLPLHEVMTPRPTKLRGSDRLAFARGVASCSGSWRRHARTQTGHLLAGPHRHRHARVPSRGCP